MRRPRVAHALAPGAGAEAIREHLLDEDRVLFDRELAAAARQGDVEVLHACTEHWRCVAVIQSDRGLFTRTARRAAERNTGHASPPDEPLAVTREKAGM